MRIPSANPYTFVPQAGEDDPYAPARTGLTRQQLEIAKRNKRLDRVRNVALSAIGGIATAGLAPAIMGAIGGGSVSAAPVIGGTTPGVSSAMAGGLPWMRLAELGVGLGTSFYGQHKQNQALDKELAYRSSADQKALTLAEQQEAQRQKEWQAQQAMLEQQFQADQEQQRLDRLEMARRAALEEGYAASNETRNVAREAQRVPYRQAGQIALRDLVGGLR